MNVPFGFATNGAGAGIRAANEFGTESAMSAIGGFFIAVGAVSAIVFTLMMRADRQRDRRRAYADSPARGSGGISSSGNDGFNLLNWFASSSSSSSGDSCASSSSFFSSSDSSGSDRSCSDGEGGGGDSGRAAGVVGD
jgi:hypothetical protein